MESSKRKFRLKVDMNEVCENPRRIWLLINSKKCFTVEDLKLQIATRFNLIYSIHRIEVLLQDFVVPDDELIDILKPEDSIVLRKRPYKMKRVSVDTNYLHNQRNGDYDVVTCCSKVSLCEEVPKRKRKKSSDACLSDQQQNSHLIQDLTATTPKVKKKKYSKEENNNENPESVIESSKKKQANSKQSCSDEIDYEAMFPIPKRKRVRRREKKKEKAITIEQDQPIKESQIVLNEKLGLDAIGNSITKRKHVRFSDDEIIDKVEKVSIIDDTPPLKNIMVQLVPVPSKENEVSMRNESQNKVNGKLPIDLSKFRSLRGPPRVRDHISYQILELSENYTPELSSLLIGIVTNYDSNSNLVSVKLDEPIMTKARRGRFELIERTNEEEDEEEETNFEEQITWVQDQNHNLNEMIDLKVFMD